MTGQSQALDELAKALTKAQAQFPNLVGDGTGQAGGSRKYKYATLGNVIETLRPILATCGLAVTQTCEPGEPATIRLTTTLLHASGQFVSGTAVLPLANNTPQGYGSAMTYARRYQYMAILGIAAEDDDDGHEGSQQRAPARQQSRQSTPATSGTGNRSQAVPAVNVTHGDDEQRWQSEQIGSASEGARAYLRTWLSKHGYDEATYRRELKERSLNGTTMIGVIVGSFPDLTGGGEPPDAYEPSAEEVAFYGSPEAAREHHQREQQANQPAGAHA